MMPIVRGKPFHGVRLLHIQLDQDEEYIFPHQMRKRLFPTMSRDQFQVWKTKANIEDKTMTAEELAAINENIGKSGGTTKVNDNCTLIRVEDAHTLYRFLKGKEMAKMSPEKEPPIEVRFFRNYHFIVLFITCN